MLTSTYAQNLSQIYVRSLRPNAPNSGKQKKEITLLRARLPLLWRVTRLVASSSTGPLTILPYVCRRVRMLMSKPYVLFSSLRAFYSSLVIASGGCAIATRRSISSQLTGRHSRTNGRPSSRITSKLNLKKSKSLPSKSKPKKTRVNSPSLSP